MLLESTTSRGITTLKGIGYLRVSTREQGRSGLGLAAQRHEISESAAVAIGKRQTALINWRQTPVITGGFRVCFKDLCVVWDQGQARGDGV
jgi:hypothetical protein